MTNNDIKTIAIEAGLDPDLWGYERAFEQFVDLIELKLLEHHIKICNKEHQKLIHESNIADSSYTRTVLRQRAGSISDVCFDIYIDRIKKAPV